MDKITFEEFEKYINKVHKVWDLQDKLYKLDIDIVNVESLETPVIQLIEKILTPDYEIDKELDDTLEWFCFEKEFGERKDLVMRNADNTIIPSDTIEDIWNYYKYGCK